MYWNTNAPLTALGPMNLKFIVREPDWSNEVECIP